MVEEWTSVTFASKKACTASAVMLDDAWTQLRPSGTSTERYINTALFDYLLTIWDTYVRSLRSSLFPIILNGAGDISIL